MESFTGIIKAVDDSFDETPMTHLERLIEHLAWADGRVLDSLRQAQLQSPAALSLYSHILGAEHAWLTRIQGVAPTVAIWPEMSLNDCERESKKLVAGFRSLVSNLSDADLQKPITYKNSAGATFTTALEDILLHVALHGSYHRGQVAALLRGAGDAPSPTDYIAWVRGAPAATRT